MIFKVGPSFSDRWDRIFDAKRKWHRWFAWHPVRVTHEKAVWWMFVERKGIPYNDMNGQHWLYEYRQIGDTDP